MRPGDTCLPSLATQELLLDASHHGQSGSAKQSHSYLILQGSSSRKPTLIA